MRLITKGQPVTPQERELLTTFLAQMTQTQAGQKDPEADALVRDACARQPDAGYLLVQRAMGLEYALQATQAQAAKMQSELDQLRAGTRSGFLDNANAWGRSGRAPTPAQAAPASAATVQGAQPAARAAAGPAPGPAAAPAPASSWGSGMLGTVATTAAGVVAGSFLFQGIQGLMGHHNAGMGDGASALEHGAGHATQPESGASLVQSEPVDSDADDSAEGATEYAVSDDGDDGSGDSA